MINLDVQDVDDDFNSAFEQEFISHNDLSLEFHEEAVSLITEEQKDTSHDKISDATRDLNNY